MQVLLQLKSYSEYFDILFEQKPESEIEKLLYFTKENNEAEIFLKKRITQESEFDNIMFIFYKIWSLSKRITKLENYPLQLLCELIEELYKTNKFKFFEEVSGLVEFSALVFIRAMKSSVLFNENQERLIYLTKNYNCKINISDVLRNERIANISENFKNENFMEEKNDIFREICSELLNIAEPTHFKTEM
jgi:hypothetical protein